MEEIKQSTNAERFIEAYNKIDYSLRAIYSLKRSMTYSEVIRRSVSVNSVVRKYEDDLIDYGRLRNAIVHQGDKEYIIAEPHIEIVEKIEFIAKIISTPPLAINSLRKRAVVCINDNILLKDAISKMYTTSFSNLPVFNENELVGVLNGQKLMNVLGYQISKNVNIEDYIEKTTVKEVLPLFSDVNYFAIASEKITIEQVLSEFNSNKKLLVIIITKGGSIKKQPIAIITSYDLYDLQKVLDIF